MFSGVLKIQATGKYKFNSKFNTNESTWSLPDHIFSDVSKSDQNFKMLQFGLNKL